jgi:hypothetical protein
VPFQSALDLCRRQSTVVDSHADQRPLTSLGQLPLVVDNGNVLLGEVDDLVVLDLPKILGDL